MSLIGYIDSHCHICSKEFDNDFDLVVENILKNNIKRVMIICSELDEVEKAISLANKYDIFDVACGIHPVDEKTYTKEIWDRFIEYSKNPKVKAIGEIGLDYHWHSDNIDKQKELFIKQINIAKSLNKPIIVHSREAMQDTFDILKDNIVNGVIHSYSGSLEMANEFIKLGYYISISGTVTFKNSIKPKEVAKYIDINRLLIETDSPYLSPVPFRGKRNEPSYVINTFEFIKELRGIQEDKFQEILCINYDELFRK